MIDGLHSENDRIVVTCAIMALLKYFQNNQQGSADDSNCITGVNINDKTITFTKKDGSTVNITLPITDDEYVIGAEIRGNILVLRRKNSQNIEVDLSSIIMGVDTSKFITRCVYNRQAKKLFFYNANGTIIESSTVVVDDFLKDGMINSIQLRDNQLTFTWNQDANKSPVTITLPDTYISGGSVNLDNSSNHYYIQLTYNDVNKQPITIQLDDFEDGLLSRIPIIPGYYKSKNYQDKNVASFSTKDTTYLGTTWDSVRQKPTAEYKYIYKVISKNDYRLVAYYKVPKPGYFYVLSSGNSYVKYNKSVAGGNINEVAERIPGGVVGIIRQNGDNLEVYRFPNFFTYLEADTSNVNPSSISYDDVVDNPNTYIVTSKDHLGNVTTALKCMFYPSRFIINNSFIGKYDWLESNQSGANAQAEAFNALLSESGYKLLYEIKYHSEVDEVNIIDSDEHSVDIINDDLLDGLRYTGVRQYIQGAYIGKASLVNDQFIASDSWLDSYLDYSQFRLSNVNNWRRKETLEAIWSYIMTNYFNSVKPDGSISSTRYSDNTGWYTTWANLCILNTSYGIIINANTECRDGEVDDPGTGDLPQISDSNLPCSSFKMTFDMQINSVKINGTITLNVGGRQWDNSDKPYRYIQHGKHNDENVVIDKQCILYKSAIKDCDFFIQQEQSGRFVTEHITMSNNTINSQLLTSGTTLQQV